MGLASMPEIFEAKDAVCVIIVRLEEAEKTVKVDINALTDCPTWFITKALRGAADKLEADERIEYIEVDELPEWPT